MDGRKVDQEDPSFTSLPHDPADPQRAQPPVHHALLDRDRITAEMVEFREPQSRADEEQESTLSRGTSITSKDFSIACPGTGLGTFRDRRTRCCIWTGLVIW